MPSASVGIVSRKGDELHTDSKAERLSVDTGFFHNLPFGTFLFHFAAYFMQYPFGSKLLDSKLLEIMRDAMSSHVSLGHSVMKQIHKVA